MAQAGSIGAVVFGLLAWQLVVFAMRTASNGEATPQLHIPLSWAWWFMSIMSAVTALAALTVAVAVFTRHPVEPKKPSEID